MSDPEYRIAHIEAIHVTTSATTALSDSNKLTGLKTFNPTTATTLQEIKHLNSDGWSRHRPIWQSGACTLAGECEKGSATQATLANAVKTNSAFYVHCISNPSATAGQIKGALYKLYAESAEEPHEAGALVTFSYPCKMDGPPVDIVAT